MFAQSKGGNYSLTNGASGVADAIDFDGTTDYLSRSSDLVGNVDSKTFTFSCWVWIPSNSTNTERYLYSNENGRIALGYTPNTNILVISGVSAAGTLVFRATITNAFAVGTISHLLLSIDLSGVVPSRIYINDINVTPAFNAFSNTSIDFTRVWHKVAVYGGGDNFFGRLSHVYLDYIVRDLSITSNRRLFITTDRKPASGQAALNPILYLPLNDPTQPGKNLGTGGDFALNGVVARSGRGPSQFNAPYSDLDGSSQYLSRTSALSGAIPNNKLTYCFSFCADSFSNTPIIHQSNTSTGTLLISANGGISCFTTAGAAIVNFQSGTTFAAGRNYIVVISFDLSDTLKRFCYINGNQVAGVWNSFNNISIPFDVSQTTVARQHLAGNYFNGRLGNVFFDTKYIDLSQPANLAKFITGTGIDAKPADLGANGEKPFGTAPLIYLPMYGNNAGKNYGTGGDFTVNSGPFTGARGQNEFWGNKADFDGTTGYLSRASALTGVSNGKTFSASFYIVKDLDASTRSILHMSSNGSNDAGLAIQLTSENKIVFYAFNSVTAQLLTATSSVNLNVAGGVYHVCVSIDLTNSTKRFIYINGVQDSSVVYSNYTNANISFNNVEVVRVGATAYTPPSNFLDGRLSEFYFTTDYIDFSQEANRLKFRDAFGNPVDLRPQIAAGTLPNPAIYMRFDPANFGKNEGTGGDFVVNGTITDGGQL